MEIGGDFWLDEIEYNNDINKIFFEFGKDNKFVMSGRTAIDVAIQDILQEKKIRNVYFPSYVCESMIQPFKDRGINIEFYNVYFDNTLKYDIDTDYDCDIFFAMNYFGYSSTNMEKYIEQFKSRGIIVIEDFTQSLLSKKAFYNKSDYVICSLRKWFPIATGGIVSKLHSNFNINFNNFDFNEEVVKNKKIAMNKKYECIKNNTLDEYKSEFLNLYKKSNLAIKEEYVNKLMDNESINYILNVNLNKIKTLRKNNVKTIYENFDIKKYKPLIKDYKENEDCLLYLPIYIEKNKLDKLNEKIYENKFYCPSHWPIDRKINDLFENELSLVCDQRYTEEQISEKIILLNKFLEEIK